jgi:tRNA(adenine34) deaminase
MQQAISQAELAFQSGEIPIGAVLVNSKTSEIAALSHNKTIKENFTSHAELNLINEFSRETGISRFDDYDLYVTLEPCTMCAAAISLARIRRLYFGLTDKKFGAVVSNINFFESTACQHKTEYYHGFYEEKIKELMQSFFKQRR